MKSILSKVISRAATTPGGRKAARPPAAAELTSRGVVAAAGSPPSYGTAPLASGALTPGVVEANLQAPQAVADALRLALDAVNPSKRAVTLVVPDMAVRVFVLDFDQLPGKTAEALSILRFRLRKMVAFDVEHASIGYQVLTMSRNECRVLAAVMPGPVLEEYEAAVRAAGYEPGAVVPATLAALENLLSDEPALVANLSDESLTMAIVQGDDLPLYRILELPPDESIRAQDIRRGVAVAMAFFEDKTGAAATRIYTTGCLSAEAFAELIAMPELEVTELVEHPATGAMTALGAASLAAAAGALKGAGQ